MSNARITTRDLNTRLTALEAGFAAEQSANAEFRTQVLALLSGAEPAQVTQPKATVTKPKARKARKAQPKAAPKALPKGVRTTRAAGGTLGRSEWNRTLTAKARLAGGDTYKRVIAAWANVQALRVEGSTPDEVLSLFVR